MSPARWLRWRLPGSGRQRIVFGVALALFLLIGHASLVAPRLDELEAEKDKGPVLRSAYRKKLAEVAGLPAVRGPRAGPAQAEPASGEPTVARLVALANEHGLRIDHLEPGDPVQVKEFFAVHSFRLQLTGNFRQFAGFAEGLATSPARLWLGQLVWRADPASSSLSLEADLDMHRSLDNAEIELRRKSAGARK